MNQQKNNQPKRRKRKYKVKINVSDSYNFYCKKEEEPLSRKDYLLICNKFNKFLADKILEGNSVVLPERLGILEIMGNEQKISIDENGNVRGTSPDWNKTLRLWEENPELKEKRVIIYYTNEETNKIVYKIRWKKERVYLHSKIYYNFVPRRWVKRELAKLIKSGKEYTIKY